MASMARLKVVILSTANFHAPLWTNKQHLAKGLAPYFDVYYIESLGLRAPKLNWKDFLRILTFLKPRKNDMESYNVEIIKPWVIPLHNNVIIRGINLLLMKLFARIRLKGLKQATLWTFSPVTYGLEDYFEKVVYHSVDFLETFPGISSKLIINSELGLVEKTNLVIASSLPIMSKLESITLCEILLLENVADTSYFTNLNLKRKPFVVFAGNLSPHKVDFEIIENLAMNGICMKIAGSISIDGGNSGQFQKILSKYHNVEFLGELKLNELNSVFNECKVGIIPYLSNNHTLGIYPMKIHEYGAAGLYVVSTKLPSLKNLNDMPGLACVDPANFVQEVKLQLENFTVLKSYSYSQYSMVKSWEDRIRTVVQKLESLNAK